MGNPSFIVAARTGAAIKNARSQALIRRHGRDRVARLVAELADTPLDRVRTIITEVPAANWGIGGSRPRGRGRRRSRGGVAPPS